MYTEDLKIPKDRVAVLIGTKGVTKKKIEKKARIFLNVSKEGEIEISGEDSLDVFNSVPIIKAIGRGFNPDKALKLLDENYSMELINIQNFTGKAKDKFTRMKARLIGTGGKARNVIERLTDVQICIYGKTVCIIGKIEDVLLAKQAVEKLLKGAPHGNVYKFIELQK
jgi:ribosomal RNA assembly protein